MPLGSHGIQVKVSAQLNKVTVRIYHNGFVAALIEVAASIVATIVGDGVGGVESLHEPTEVCLRGHKNKVKMIFHEHIGLQLDGVEGAGRWENLKKTSLIVIITEYLLLFIPPAGDMIPGTGVFYAKGSHHEIQIARSCCFVNS